MFQFWSRSFKERSTSLGIVARKSEVSDAKKTNWFVLHSLGLSDDPPSGGFPQVRGHTGFVFRWREGWFEELRERVGWRLERHDKPGIAVRVSFLMQLFRRTRTERTFAAITDLDPPSIVQAIEDG